MGDTSNKEDIAGYRVRQQIPDFPVASLDRSWDATEVDNRLRNHVSDEDIDEWGSEEFEQYWRYFIVVELDDGSLPQSVTAFGFGYADIIDGEPHIVPSGVFAGAAALQGARQEPDLPDEVMSAMQNTYETLYDRIDEEYDEEDYEAPWVEQSTGDKQEGGTGMELDIDDSIEVMLESVERAAWQEFDNYEPNADEEPVDAHKLYTFNNEDGGNYLVWANVATDTLYRTEFTYGEDGVEFGSTTEVKQSFIEANTSDVTLKEFVAKSDNVTEFDEIIMYKNLTGVWPNINVKEKEQEGLGGFIIKQNQQDEKMIAEGPVLVPDEPDHDDDVVSKEKVQEVAYEWMLRYRNVDLQHSLNNVATPVESWISREDRTVTDLNGNEMEIPEGTWMVSVKVQDENTWEAVKNGELGGFSIMGVPVEEIEKAVGKSQKVPESALKRTTLSDIEERGQDWAVPFFSLVDEPAVPKAVITSLKSKNDKNENKSFIDVVKDILFKSEEDNSEQEQNNINERGDIDMDREELEDMLENFKEDTKEEVMESTKELISEILDEDEEKTEKEEEEVDEEPEEGAEKEEEEKQEETEEVDKDDEDDVDVEELRKELKEVKDELEDVRDEKNEFRDTLKAIQNKFNNTQKSNQPNGQEDGEEEKEEDFNLYKELGRGRMGQREEDE